MQALTESRDPAGAGGVVSSWATVATISCEREGKGAFERYAADQRYAGVAMVFRTRYIDPGLLDFDPKVHRLVYRDRIYNVLGVEEIGRKEGMHIVCAARGDREGNP